MSVQPNFLLIGAQKAGTTWLSAMLRAHPEVFVPEAKELHFFNLRENYARGMDWYRSQFAEHAGERAIGECTPNYLWVSDAPAEAQAARVAEGRAKIAFEDYPILIRDIPRRVRRDLGDLQLIVSLRNPVDRAVSRFYHAIRARKFSPRSRLLDVGGREGILGMGFYYRHLVEWFRHYPRESFLILVYEEDLASAHKPNTLKQVYRHIGVDETVEPENIETRYNVRTGNLYMYLNWYAPRLARRVKRSQVLQGIQFPRIQVSDDELRQLHRLYRDENGRLEELLGRSLAVWGGDRRAG